MDIYFLSFHWKDLESNTVFCGPRVARFQAPWQSGGMLSSLPVVTETQKWPSTSMLSHTQKVLSVSHSELEPRRQWNDSKPISQ